MALYSKEMPYYHAYYETYSEEQLAADEFFQQWVLAEDRRNNHFWKGFVEIYADRFDTVLNARRLVKELAANPYTSAPLTSQEKALIRESIYDQLNLSESPVHEGERRGAQKKYWFRGLLAAGIAGIAIAIFLLFPARSTPATMLVEETGSKEIKEVMLPDSSVVVLNAHSSLTFSSRFTADSVRTVYLRGNAYFNVKKTAEQKPFIVHADELRIRVTGTEFNVNARTKATDIVLTSGRINVSMENGQRNTAFMAAGDRLQLDTVQRQFVTSAANTDLYMNAWKNKEWHFQETSLDSIAELIREYYGMDMVFATNKQKKLMITAIVSVNDFSTLVNVIAKTLNIKIKEESNQLLIY